MIVVVFVVAVAVVAIAKHVSYQIHAPFQNSFASYACFMSLIETAFRPHSCRADCYHATLVMFLSFCCKQVLAGAAIRQI